MQISCPYKSTAEYRQCLRSFFEMRPDAVSITTLDETSEQTSTRSDEPIHMDVDDETRDEWTYDEDATKIAMDRIYDKTKSDPLFQELYDLAAARMFSTDREIGLAILCSYDCLFLFMEVLSDNPMTSHSAFYALKKRLV